MFGIVENIRAYAINVEGSNTQQTRMAMLTNHTIWMDNKHANLKKEQRVLLNS